MWKSQIEQWNWDIEWLCFNTLYIIMKVREPVWMHFKLFQLAIFTLYSLKLMNNFVDIDRLQLTSKQLVQLNTCTSWNFFDFNSYKKNFNRINYYFFFCYLASLSYSCNDGYLAFVRLLQLNKMVIFCFFFKQWIYTLFGFCELKQNSKTSIKVYCLNDVHTNTK